MDDGTSHAHYASVHQPYDYYLHSPATRLLCFYSRRQERRTPWVAIMTESHNHSTNSTTAGDLESNETTPLLHSSSNSSSKVNVKSVEPGVGAVTVRVVIQEDASPQESQELSEEEERRRMRRQVAKYVLWFVLGGVVLGLLVKGIIDSGDSNVSLTFSAPVAENIV